MYLEVLVGTGAAEPPAGSIFLQEQRIRSECLVPKGPCNRDRENSSSSLEALVLPSSDLVTRDLVTRLGLLNFMPFDPLLSAATYIGSRFLAPEAARTVNDLWYYRGSDGYGNSPAQAVSNMFRSAVGLPHRRVDAYRGPSLIDASTVRHYFRRGMSKLRGKPRSKYSKRRYSYRFKRRFQSRSSYRPRRPSSNQHGMPRVSASPSVGFNSTSPSLAQRVLAHHWHAMNRRSLDV